MYCLNGSSTNISSTFRLSLTKKANSPPPFSNLSFLAITYSSGKNIVRFHLLRKFCFNNSNNIEFGFPVRCLDFSSFPLTTNPSVFIYITFSPALALHSTFVLSVLAAGLMYPVLYSDDPSSLLPGCLLFSRFYFHLTHLMTALVKSL